MAKIVIQTDSGEVIMEVPFQSGTDSEGNSFLYADENTFAALKLGLPGIKGEVGDPGATQDWESVLPTLATRGEDGIIPSDQLPAVSGGGGSGGGEITKIARLAFPTGTAAAYDGVLPLTVTKEDQGSYVNAAVAGTFKMPDTLPAGCMVRLTHCVEFSSSSGARTVSFLRNGSAAWAGNVVRNLTASMERESVAASALIVPVAGEVYSLSATGGQVIVKGDNTWFQIEVKYNG